MSLSCGPSSSPVQQKAVIMSCSLEASVIYNKSFSLSHVSSSQLHDSTSLIVASLSKSNLSAATMLSATLLPTKCLSRTLDRSMIPSSLKERVVRTGPLQASHRRGVAQRTVVAEYKGVAERNELVLAHW